PAAEVTFRSDAAADAIKLISENVPECFVCAGTVLTPEQAETAVKAGAKAIISPGTNPAVVEWCVKNDIPVFPGCATPTEVEACMRMGLTTVKLFPAEVVGGVGMLKALSGPYSQIKFMPTGGVKMSNAESYLTQPNCIAAGGTWICPVDAINDGNFELIENNAHEAAELVKKLRG
ncbi:MAG: bifunctional 4-hydroxy-2-oxoglutarate aldolase/2-dehydro-3-deoxy-phosphogluconate aldolase, partial [Clostridia bacterium]|nr:bifunctional 4-hydroxy-2-oxoglutarate aldolase/2-dehydro-3-deoxy-phosphogluconate aldolase [Clostridia bacterium]